MGLEENIVFVKSQIDLYQTALAGSRERVNECAARYHGMDRDLRDKQQELRSLRQELVRPSSSPSRSTIQEIVRLQAFADRLRSVDDLANSMTDELKRIAGEWVQAMDRLKRLPSDELTQSDKRKIDRFEQYVREHLERYGFRSFQPSEICLSRDNFRPLVTARDGDGGVIEKEINFDISASDAIRLKWSYYLSAMELSGSETTNHPKMVIFDEPGQQEIEASSLYEFMTGASLRAGLNEQIIVSTSETLSNVRAALPADVNVVSFEGFILQPFP